MLTGKVYLVTGASRGVGKGIALKTGKVFYASELAHHYRLKDENRFEPPSGHAFIGEPPCCSSAVVE